MLSRGVEPDQLQIAQPRGPIIMFLKRCLENYHTLDLFSSSTISSLWWHLLNQPVNNQFGLSDKSAPLPMVQAHISLVIWRLLSCLPGSPIQEGTWCSFRAIYQAGLNLRALKYTCEIKTDPTFLQRLSVMLAASWNAQVEFACELCKITLWERANRGEFKLGKPIFIIVV